MRAGEMWPFNGALPVIEHRGAIRGRWKVAQHWCPTHELIDIPVTSLSVGRWPTMVPNPALQRGKVAQHWCPTPLNVGNVAQIRCPALSFICLLPIPSPVDKCLTISPPHNIGVCWQVA